MSAQVGSGIGGRLKAVRLARKLSLADVSAATDVSTSFLSLIENDKSDITFSRLIRLVEFYGISVIDLLPENGSEDSFVVRASEQRHVESAVEGIDLFVLSTKPDRSMMPVLVVFEPGGGTIETAAHPGEDFIYVLEGTIELTLEGHEATLLRKGDSAYYRSERKHAFRNMGNGRARFIAVSTPPSL
jgi:quercetin dioxygenase-like cupin family protein/DNA-binding Xre family transcriptional regulator